MTSHVTSTDLRADRIVAYVMFVTLAMSAHAALAAPAKPAALPARGPGHVICSTPIQHPLNIHAQALGAIVRGAPLRVRVTTTAALGLDRGEVRLISSGGAAVVGASRAVLSVVPAGGQTHSEFTVMVPTTGHRFLLQFRVRGEGGGQNLTRGATLNLLPDGPAERLTAAVTGTGERLLEVRAGRIVR